ncbi:MAG: amino acid ABC transporter permease [Alphaproteobacteria bacterium]|nr:amino acid ABC transporter permease [Alphaproteobacteria bacterium]
MAHEQGIDLYLYIIRVLATGAWVTIEVAVGSLLFSMLVAAPLANAQSLGGPTVKAIIRVYVEVFRAVPVLTQLFIIYFGLATLGLKLGSITAAIIGLGLNGSAYCAEIFRAGIEAVPRGQTEAARALGLRRWQVFRLVVLPQAVRMVLPPLTNFSIQLLKNTSVASAVAAPEIMLLARNLVNETFLSPQIYLSVCLVYLCISLPMIRLAGWLERRTGAFESRQ